jgi:protein ImuB
MKLAQAQAMVPGLVVQDADLAGDAAALRDLAGWCLRYAPMAAADPPDGIWIDVTGSAHLFGGESRLLRDLVGRLADRGFAARAAVADVPAVAHAVARFGGDVTRVVPVGASVMADFPIEALRLPSGLAADLRRLGFERIGALAEVARAPVVRRYGKLLALRLDQAAGRVAEPIVPVVPSALIQARLAFVEPLMTAEAFASVIGHLVPAVCRDLEHAGQGARRLDLLFERVDGSIAAIRVGTAGPVRYARHLGRMLTERLERVDPGPGVEAMRLVVAAADPLGGVQAGLVGAARGAADVAPLVDVLANRLGASRLYRLAPVDSHVPERSVRRVPALAAVQGAWPVERPRPVRLLDPPQPVEAMALLPDAPPVAFTWRRVRHLVRHADGPERIAGEWWKQEDGSRDYFRVEDEAGRQFWLFRSDVRWFLHGFF